MAGLGSGRTHRIVGRVRELTVIRNALEDAGSGKSRVIVFGGPPGIGKTTLAEEACRLGEAESATVCWVRCSDVAPASPLWVWQRIVEQLTIEDRHSVLKKLADFAGEATEQPEADRAGRGRFAVFEAVRRSLVEACAVGLHVVVIDNLQWADIASLDLFEYLCQQARRLAVLIVATFRNVDIPARHPVYLALGEVEREAGCEQFVLDGISLAQTGELIRERTGYDPTEAEIDALHLTTEGNPLYLVEIAREVAQSETQILSRIGTGAFIRALPNLRGTILARVFQLGIEIADLLGTAALIGREFPDRVLSSVAGIPMPEVSGLLTRAETAGLVQTNAGPGVWRFSHALVRDALAATVDDSRTAPVHADIGRALESYFGKSCEEHAAELAGHYAIAAANGSRDTQRGDEIARAGFRYTNLAGDQMRRSGDFEAAAKFFDQAIEYSDGLGDPTLIAHVHWRLALVEEALGRATAIDHFSHGFSIFYNLGDYQTALRCMASTHFPTSFLDPRPMEMLERVLPKVPADLPAAVLARIQIAERRYGMTKNHDEYRGAIDPELDTLSRIDAPDVEMEALSASIYIDFFHIRKCEAFYDRLFELADTSKNLAAEALGRLNASFFAYFYPASIDEARGGRRQIDAALFRGEQIRDHRIITFVLMARARANFGEGRWKACEADLERGIALYSYFEHSTPVRLRALMASEHGEIDAYSEIVESSIAADTFQSGGINAIIELAWAIAIGALLRGDDYRLPAARETCERILGDGDNEEGMVWRGLIGLGIAAVAAGSDDISDIQARIIAFEGRCERTRRSNCLFRGVISAAAGDDARALELFRSEIELADATGARVMKVWTARFWAETSLKRHPDSFEPPDRRLLHGALDIAKEVGMTTSAGHLEGIIDMLAQIEKEHAAPREFGLSSREDEVLRHIALGETNQEISRNLYISEHTVAHHVTRIFEKIGVDNRTSAATLAVRNGLARKKEQ